MTRATRSSCRIRFNTDAGATSAAVVHLECGAGLAIADGGPGVRDRPLACTLAGSTRGPNHHQRPVRRRSGMYARPSVSGSMVSSAT
jgi:hypothetical protein